MADELKDQLKRWGMATVARLAGNDDGFSMGDSVLAKQRDLGMRSKLRKADDHEIVGRDGEERRRYMAAKASMDRCAGCGALLSPTERKCPVCGAAHAGAKLRLAVLPMWAVDPIPARNDAARPFDREPIPVDLVPDDLQWINRALARLAREFPLREMIVREEFCGTGTHEMKAGRVQQRYGGKLTVRQYRTELQRALEWIRGSKAA